MNLQTKHVRWLLVMLVIWIFSCGAPATTSVPVASTAVPGAVETYIAGTQGAIASQTAAALPTITNTPTITPTATRTPTDTPPPTATIIFVLFTATKPRAYGSSSQFNCSVLSTSPEIVKVNQTFDAKWGIKNTGSSLWSDTSVDYAYVSGTPMHTRASYDLPTAVASGGEVTISVTMIAPAKIGYYTTVWSLRRGKASFCQLSFTVYVGE